MSEPSTPAAREPRAIGQPALCVLASVFFALWSVGSAPAQDLGESFCTDQLLFSQPPELTASLYSEATCDGCPSGAQSLADAFFVPGPTVVTEVVVWGWYYPNNAPPPLETWTVVLHTDTGFSESTEPALTLSAQVVPDPMRTDTGRIASIDGFSLDEKRWRLRLDEPVRLPSVGWYWVEAYHDSPKPQADASIAFGTSDALLGDPGLVVSTVTPGANWQRDNTGDLAMQVCGYFGGWDGLLIPGFEIDIDNPEDRVLFAVRNLRSTPTDIEIAYYGEFTAQAPPLRVDPVRLDPNQTYTTNPAFDTTDLDPDGDRIIRGYLVVSEVGGGTENIEGDFVRVDFENDFATGARMISPDDFCQVQELRVADFGSGSTVRYVVRSLEEGMPAFRTTVYDEPGNLVATVDVFSNSPVGRFQVEDLVQNYQFGTIVFDFSASGGGVVTGISSAFGRFSTETQGACRDDR